MQLLYHLHTNRFYRTLFYHRLGPVKSTFIRWYRPGDRYFSISATTKTEIQCGLHILMPQL